MLLNQFQRKEKIKTVLTTIVASMFVIVFLWACLFVTDYMLYTNSKPTIFTNSRMEKTEVGNKIYEEGICYTIVTDEKDNRTLYLFNKEIRSK